MTEMSFEETILRELGAAPTNVIPDGKIHRFRIGKSKDNGWYVYHDGEFAAGAFGNWATGEQHKWRHKNGACKLTPVDRSRIKAQLAQREAEIAKGHERAAKEAAALWEKASPANPVHPYLAKKQVRPHGIRENAGRLIVPVHVGGKIASVQMIDADGKKMFLKDGRTGGGVFQIGEIGGEVIIADGFATVATLHELFQTATIAAFSASNLLAAAKGIREKYPDVRIILAADDDFKTAQKLGVNPGVKYATEAALAVGGLVASPSLIEPKGIPPRRIGTITSPLMALTPREQPSMGRRRMQRSPRRTRRTTRRRKPGRRLSSFLARPNGENRTSPMMTGLGSV